MRRAVALLLMHARLAVQVELQYRANLVAQLLQSIVQMALALASVQLVFSHTESLAGWSRDELYVLVGCWFIVDGLLMSWAVPSLRWLVMKVQQGDFDYVLVRPEDPQTLMSVQHVEPWPLVNVTAGVVLAGIGMAGTGFADDGVAIMLVQLAAALVTIVAGVIALYSMLLAAATLCFRYLRVGDLIFALTDTIDAGRWPLGVFPPWLRTVLTFIIPAGIAVTVPAESLIGTVSAGDIVLSLGVAVAGAIISRRLFLRGVKRYSGASS